MIYSVQTENGLGIEICGTRKEMNDLYALVSKFWDNQTFSETKGFDDRKKIIGEFLKEIKNSSTITEMTSDNSMSEISKQSFRISWVNIIFFLNALKYNMNLDNINEEDLDRLVNLTDMIGNSMKDYDSDGSMTLLPYLEIGIYTGNEYMIMKHINESFFKMGGGKDSFRKLSVLMRISTYLSDEYETFMNFLKSQAEINQCDIKDLQFNGESEIYKRP